MSIGWLDNAFVGMYVQDAWGIEREDDRKAKNPMPGKHRNKVIIHLVSLKIVADVWIKQVMRRGDLGQMD